MFTVTLITPGPTLVLLPPLPAPTPPPIPVQHPESTLPPVLRLTDDFEDDPFEPR